MVATAVPSVVPLSLFGNVVAYLLICRGRPLARGWWVRRACWALLAGIVVDWLIVTSVVLNDLIHGKLTQSMSYVYIWLYIFPLAIATIAFHALIMWEQGLLDK